MKRIGFYQKRILLCFGAISCLILTSTYLSYQALNGVEEENASLILILLINAVSIVSCWLFFWFYSKPFLIRINNLKEGILNLIEGNFTTGFRGLNLQHEVGQVMTQVDVLANRLQEAVLFAQKVGKGDFAASLTPASEEDQLSTSLMNMKDDLHRAHNVEQERKWVNEGLARFAAILRHDSEDLSQFGDSLLANLVKYIGASQGKFYTLEQANEAVHLELRATYAFSRKKFLSQQVLAGEGLLGQLILEKDCIYLTDIPANYIRIASGLGASLPRNIFIIPLLYNGELYGALELASFKELQKFETEFIERLAESIAAFISRFKININTKHLLRESQEQAERLQAQEETRRNLEDTLATHEQQLRLKQELADKVNELEQAKQEIEITREREKKRADDQIATQSKQLEKIVQRYEKREKNLQERIAVLEDKIPASEGV